MKYKLDESKEIIHNLQKKNRHLKPKNFKTEPSEDPYKIAPQNSQYFMDIPIYDDYSMQRDSFMDTQKNMPQRNPISPNTKERLLDLLCLSTGELKKKFNEEKVNKVSNRSVHNRLKIPKTGNSKFPQDFFNVLFGTNS